MSKRNGKSAMGESLKEARFQGLIPALSAGYEPAVEVERPPIVPDRIPERVTLAQLDTGDRRVAAAVGVARAWAERKRSGQEEASLVLVGPTGAGKTHIARAILWSMVQAAVDDDGLPIEGTQRPTGRFYMANELVQKLDSSTLASQLVGNAPVVVVDDVGAEQTIEFVSTEAQAREKQHRYFKLINYCYDFRVSVVITSNLSLGGLKEVLGDRCWSRLQFMAPAGFMVDLTGVPDWRARQSGR